MSETTNASGFKKWEVHTTTHNWYSGSAWQNNEKLTRTTESYSVIAPGKTDEDTVLVAEINTSNRNPFKFPADPRACAQLIAAAPDMLAMLRQTATFLEERAEVVRLLGRTVGADASEEAAKLYTKAFALRQLAAKAEGK